VGRTAPRKFVALVLREGLTLSGAGVAIGLTGALLVVRLISNALVGVSASDPATYLTAGILQAAIAIAACLLPALRAMRADPMLALRQE
jgi:putative ABC transport system permease protein